VFYFKNRVILYYKVCSLIDPIAKVRWCIKSPLPKVLSTGLF